MICRLGAFKAAELVANVQKTIVHVCKSRGSKGGKPVVYVQDKALQTHKSSRSTVSAKVVPYFESAVRIRTVQSFACAFYQTIAYRSLLIGKSLL